MAKVHEVIERCRTVGEPEGLSVIDVLKKDNNMKELLCHNILKEGVHKEIITHMENNTTANDNEFSIENVACELTDLNTHIADSVADKGRMFIEMYCAYGFNLSFDVTVPMDNDAPDMKFNISIEGNRGSETFQDVLSVVIMESHNRYPVHSKFEQSKLPSASQFLNACDVKVTDKVEAPEGSDIYSDDLFEEYVDDDRIQLPLRKITFKEHDE